MRPGAGKRGKERLCLLSRLDIGMLRDGQIREAIAMPVGWLVVRRLRAGGDGFRHRAGRRPDPLALDERFQSWNHMLRLRHDPRCVGWAKAAPTFRLIRDTGSAVPTFGAAVGTADHASCSTVTPRPPLPTLRC